MDHVSGFFHRVVGICHALGHAVAATPEALASLPGKISTVAQNVFQGVVPAYREVKRIWNLGPIQVTKNATKTFWAATQILRKPELVLERVPDATNVFRYGAMTCSFFQAGVPFDLNLLADSTELTDLTIKCSSKETVNKKLVLDFTSKLMQMVISVGIKPIIDQQAAESLAFQSLECAAGAFAVASTVVTIYVNRNKIKDAASKGLEICDEFHNLLDDMDQGMADAEPSKKELEEHIFWKKPVKEEEKEPETRAASLNKEYFVEEKEPETRAASLNKEYFVKEEEPIKVEEKEPIKKETKRRGISNPVQSLSQEEKKKIDEAVRQLDDFWFFDSLPPPPKKKL